MNLLFERKQIPRIVVTIRNSRKPIDSLEPISLPWAQGIGRSNRPAPTKVVNSHIPSSHTLPVTTPINDLEPGNLAVGHETGSLIQCSCALAPVNGLHA